MRKVLLLIASLLLLLTFASAQADKTAFAPAYVTGYPGPSKLFVSISSGSLVVNNVTVSVPSAYYPVLPNTTNYIFLDLDTGVLSSNTTGFTGNIYPIATAVTNSNIVTTLTDQRPAIFGGGRAASVVTGASLPATCNPGPPTTDLAGMSTAGITTFYYCKSANTWAPTAQSGLSLIDNGSTIRSSEPLYAPSFTATQANGGLVFPEGDGSAVGCLTGQDCLFGNSTNHCIEVINNGIDTGQCIPSGPGVPTGVAAGSALVSTSVGAAPAYQTKPYIDVRDYGVVCGTSTDSTAGVNAAFAAVPNWGTILFPPACPIKITSTITVSNKLGMKVIFREAPDAANNSSATGLYWFGPAGGDMLYLNQVHGGEWNGLQLYCSGAGTGFPSTAGCNRALVIGELGTVLNISTAITFHGGYIQNQETNASFIGVEIGDTAPANVENMHFDHFPVECGLSIPGSATGAIGFHINGTTAQPDNTIIEGAGPVYCSKGLYIVGNTKLDKIRNFTGGSNYTDLSVGGGSDLTYEGIRSENSTQPIALTTTQNGTITLRKLEFGNPGAPQISITAGVGGQLLLDSINFGGSGIQALSFGTSPGNSMRIVESNSSNYDSLFSSNLLVAGGGVYSSTFGYTPLNIAASIKYPLAFNQTGPSSLIQWSSSYFNNVSAIEQDYFRTGVINAPANAAATWIMDYVKPPDYAEVTSLAFGLPFSGISTIAVNTPVTPTISNSGTAGSTSYTYAVVARGGYGTSAASTTASTATGNATLSGNNCNVVTFVNLNTNSTKNTGIWSYDIYRTASSGTPSSTGKIGSVAALAASGLQYSFSDCGASGDSSTAPSVNTSGGFGSAGPITYNTDNSFDFGASGANRPRTGYFATSVVSTAYQTTTNCSSSASPAVCASAAAGSVVIAAAATTVQVNTTAVTANSQITIDFDESLGTKLSVTCNTASASEGATYFVSARTAGTSFTIKTSVAPTTNPACLSYTIVN